MRISTDSRDVPSTSEVFSDYLQLETTPAYMYSGSAAKWLGKYLPDTKYIMVLRNPVDRFHSEYAAKHTSSLHVCACVLASTRSLNQYGDINNCSQGQVQHEDSQSAG